MNNQPTTRRSRLLRAVAIAAVTSGLASIVIWGFIEGRTETAMEAERERPVKAPLRVSTQNGEPVITLDANTRQRSGVETALLTSTPYQRQERAYGTVLDLARLTDLSNSYMNAKAQRQTAQAKLAASKAAFERAQKLYRDQQNVSAAQLQAAEATFHGDEAALAAAEAQVEALVATVQQEWGPALGKSLMDRTDLVTRLIERQDFLLQVTLPPGVTVSPPPATAYVQTGDQSRARVRFISPATRTDPKIQGVSYLYVAPADGGLLPGMNILAFLPSGPEVQGETVPPAAIVWWQDRAWVYRRTGSNVFTRIEISTDLPTPGGGYIVKDLPKDTEVVTRSAQLLLSEEFRAQIQVGQD
jgi:hypothetical protein